MPMTFAVVTFDSFWSATRWTTILFILFKHQRQRAEATYMPVKSVQ